MNWNHLEGRWHELKDQLKAKWAKLTDNDLMQIDGKRDRLIGKIMERYGQARDKAEQELDTFVSALDVTEKHVEFGTQHDVGVAHRHFDR